MLQSQNENSTRKGGEDLQKFDMSITFQCARHGQLEFGNYDVRSITSTPDVGRSFTMVSDGLKSGVDLWVSMLERRQFKVLLTKLKSFGSPFGPLTFFGAVWLALLLTRKDKRQLVFRSVAAICGVSYCRRSYEY